ncbi:MAG: P-type DNA transfer ATPase VirB11 [Alphaproteobacteria bacterium]|nr:MAG: P-type DNA transfer ATPase VirB11 [Alphaproteobacteria bacterium]
MIADLPESGVYLNSFLLPFRPWLDRPDVSELIVNRPGEVWIELQGAPAMERHDAPDIDDLLISRLATQVARQSRQAINSESPLLGATLPGGERIQIVAPSATRGHWALAIRRHRMVDLSLDVYRGQTAPAAPSDDILQRENADMVDRLRAAVRARKTVLISGGTSSGKTTFLNALLKEVPAQERIVVVEDTPEIQLRHQNALGLVAVQGTTDAARIGTDDLLKAALRLRPDRLLLGEIRGTEAVTFLRAINTGHPGSFTTVHANTPEGALEQLALMVMQARLGLGRDETVAYIRSLVDIIVQLGRAGGQRFIADFRDLRAGT